MKRKRLPKSALIIVFALTMMLAIPLAGCRGELGFAPASSSASLSKAAMCKSVDLQTEEPIEPTNTFATDTLEIFCSVKLSNAPSGTEVGAEWLYVQDETGAVKDLLIDTWSRITEGTRYVSSSITKPGTDWPRGDYEAILYLNGSEIQSVSFKVQ